MYWGCLQTLLGLWLYLCNFANKHYSYKGVIVTEWRKTDSVSLGLFVFVAAKPPFIAKYAGQFSAQELKKALLVHEYGHSLQSLILGPFYLAVIGIPSLLWGYLGAGRRRRKQLPYGAFYTESWADKLGGRVTGQQAIGELALD